MSITGKLQWLLVCLLSLMAIMPPRPIFAQGEKTDLILMLSPINYQNDLKVGVDNKLFLEVRNIGNTTITRIRLSSQVPEGWVVEFMPAEIASLSAGNLQTVDLIVKPDSKATKGGYNITIIAEANEIRKAETIWLNLKTPASFWIWIGAIIVAVVIALFIFIFVRFNRQ